MIIQCQEKKVKMAFTFKQFREKPNLENAFKIMGDNPNTAILVASAVALFKGIFRPMFTMMDKKSDPETKKYAAIREGLTELIAIPVYVGIPLGLGKFIEKKFFNEAPKVTKKAVNTNVKFLAVLASTAIIPAICNIIQPPIMEAYKKSQNTKKMAQFNNVSTSAEVSKPSFSGRQILPVRTSNKINYGMRVGS